MNRANLQSEVKAVLQETQVRIALVALAVTGVAIIVTASALNAIDKPKLRHDGMIFHADRPQIFYGIAHVSMPKGNKILPQELLPEP